MHRRLKIVPYSYRYKAADLLMVNKYPERIGDHATNIAEWVIFSAEDHIGGKE